MAAGAFSVGVDSCEDTFVQTAGLHETLAPFSDDPDGMGFIDDEVGSVFFAELDQLDNRSEVAIHREYGFGDNKNRPGKQFPVMPEFVFQILQIVMSEREALRKRESDPIPYRSVTQGVIKDDVPPLGHYAQHAGVGVVPGVEKQGGFALVELGDLRFRFFGQGGVAR
jgi:hypothetical protein